MLVRGLGHWHLFFWTQGHGTDPHPKLICLFICLFLKFETGSKFPRQDLNLMDRAVCVLYDVWSPDCLLYIGCTPVKKVVKNQESGNPWTRGG